MNKNKKCILVDLPISMTNICLDESTRRAVKEHAVSPPIGLAYIAAYLRENGIDTEIIDAGSLGLSVEEVALAVEEERPAFVGITVLTPQLKSALSLAERIKQACPAVKVILGGPHIYFEHRDVIKKDYVDYCVRGEGEITALELLRVLSDGGDLRKVKGITFKRGDEVYVTPDRTVISDLDSLPFPARDLLPNHLYRVGGALSGREKLTTMLATRGCPFGCNFCAAARGAMWGGRAQRRRSVKNVIAELEHVYRDYEVRFVRFVDDLLVVNKRWTIELCRAMVERGLDSIKWVCDGRVGLMSEELLEELKRANCQVIFYGIEFGNQRILDFSGKGTTIPQIYETIEMTKKAGIASYGYFMIGYPTETVETIEETISLAKSVELDYAGFSIVTPFPGTQLYKYCKNNDMLTTTDWEEYNMLQPGRGVIRLKEVTDEELMTLYRRAQSEFAFRHIGEELRQELSSWA